MNDVATISVSELMSKDVFTCRPADTLNGVLDVMRRRRFRHVPVVDENDKLAGIVTSRVAEGGCPPPAPTDPDVRD